MKTSLLGLLFLVICMTTFTHSALAQPSSRFENNRGQHHDSRNNRRDRDTRHVHNSRCGHIVTPPRAVPEIDAASAGLALALTGGLLAVYRERRKSE